MDELSRRDVLQRGMGSIALLCALPAARPRRGKRPVTSAALRAQDASPFRPFRRDLPLPPELVPVRRTHGADVYESAIRSGTAEILPGYETPIYGYEGLYPGPTIRARKGREAIIRQTNDLGFDVNVHLHGGSVPSGHDGHPMDLIAPGASFEYRYPNDQDAATLWYHDHAHGQTARSLHYGLAAFYLLEDEREAQLDLPRGDFDLPLMIQDHAFNRDGSFRYASNVEPGFLGDTILVNGAVAPRVQVRQRIYRLRLLNASNAREYTLQLGEGRRMVQIASDGGLLARPVARRSITLAPAERIDVLVDFRRFASGSRLALRNTAGAGSTVAVMRFDVERGGGSEEARIPRGRLRTIDRIPPPAIDRRWDLSLATAGGIAWHIDGRGFDMERIDCRPRLGSSERWSFVNTSTRSHPMHLHGFHFRVRSRSSGPVHPGDRGWKDTVAVKPGETVTVQPWFSPYTGPFVFHCHALEHGDFGMMLQMEVQE